MLPTVMIAVAVAAGSGHATVAHPLVGVWKINFPVGTRIENGEATVIKGTGQLTVEAVGDSLVARLVADPMEGMPARPAARFSGKALDGTTVFVQRSVAKININGAEQEATSVSTWTLTAKGDALEGTIERKLDGFDAPSAGPQPVTGTRQRA